MFITQPFAERGQDKMKEVLMNPNASAPAVHYYMIRGGSDKGNITVWESGVVGGEYIKTYGHYHVGDLDETYRILLGEGIVLLQKRQKDSVGNPVDDQITEFHAVYLKAGEEIFIPSEYGHLMVNTGSSWLVTADDSPVNFGEAHAVSMPGHADYEAVRKMKGFAYYVVEEDSKPTLIRNTLYSSAPEACIVSLSEYKSKI